MAHGSDGALMTALTQLCAAVLRLTTALPKTIPARRPSIALVRASTSAVIAFDQSRRHEHGPERVRLVVRAAKDIAEVSAWLSHVATLEETVDLVAIATLLAEAELVLAALALRLVGEPEAAELAAQNPRRGSDHVGPRARAGFNGIRRGGEGLALAARDHGSSETRCTQIA